jgi:hypothetical protein
MPSRGISPIQRKARGNKMAKKSGMPTLAKKESMKARVTKRAPALNAMSLGAANAPMPPAAGLRTAGPMGMKSGGSCGTKKMACGGKAMKGYYKGGSVDGCISKGHTKGKFV